MPTISKAQLAANQANSKLSTGPKTPAGKTKIRLNSIKHGHSSHTVVIPEHEKAAFKAHFESFKNEYRPVGPTEEFMTQSLAEISWSAQQIRCKITTFMTMLGTQQNDLPDRGDDQLNYDLAQTHNLGNNIENINLLSIYEQRKMRVFNSTRRELVQIQADRKAAETEELVEASAFRQTAPKGWQPAQDGFACSLAQIDRFIARQHRLSAARPLMMAS